MMGGQPREPKGTSTGGRFARLPGPMGDDPADPAPVSPLMTNRGLAALLYRMGVTFDGLNASRMATEEFLRTGDPRVIGSRDDYALLQDLRDAAEYTLGYDYDIAVPVDEPDRTVFNRLLGRWYLHDEPDVIRWLADWNRTNPAD